MLQSHLAAVEQQLLATSKIPANSGNSLSKGTPREAFISEFLASHLGRNVQVGTGEIIDGDSVAGQKRPQLDVIIARSDLPRIDFGGGVKAFLAEAAVATVEVKSLLDEAKLKDAIEAAVKVKALKRESQPILHSGYLPPGILCFVVAYECVATIGTVYGWIEKIYKESNLSDPMLGDWPGRSEVSSTSLDGIFVLGKGYILLDNSVLAAAFLTPENRVGKTIRWLVIEPPSGSLFVFFMLITMALSGVAVRVFQIGQYVHGFITGPTAVGTGVGPPSASPVKPVAEL
jgi:hypothetical protein